MNVDDRSSSNSSSDTMGKRKYPRDRFIVEVGLVPSRVIGSLISPMLHTVSQF